MLEATLAIAEFIKNQGWVEDDESSRRLAIQIIVHLRDRGLSVVPPPETTRQEPPPETTRQEFQSLAVCIADQVFDLARKTCDLEKNRERPTEARKAQEVHQSIITLSDSRVTLMEKK